MDLFPYQIEGASFLAERPRALLADGMGLGKSAQAIRGCDMVGASRIIVICPASVRFVWHREFRKFGATPRLVDVLKKAPRKPPTANVLVVSWDMIRSAAVLEALKAFRAEVLIMDESHYAKNWDAKRTQAVLGPAGLAHYAARCWCLSGTPMPNHAGELFPMLNTLFSEAITPPGSCLPMSKEEYESRYCLIRPYRVSAWTTVDRIVGSKNLPELGLLMKPFFLRRKAEDVLKDMPPIRFSVLTVECRDDPYEDHHPLESVHPDDLEDLAPGFAEERHLCGLNKVGPVCDLLEDEFASGLDKIVLFAWHRDVIDALASRLAAYNPVRVDGSTRDREGAVDRFQTDPTCRVFIGQVIAAGTGLTLTAANQALFVETGTSPEDNAQAAKRIHRVGQSRPCFVRFAALAGSIDEAIMELTRRKTAAITKVFA